MKGCRRRFSRKVVVGAVAAVVIGASLAGASVLGVDIGQPLAFERRGNELTQVLPERPPPVSAPIPEPPTGDFSAVEYLRRFVPGAPHDARPSGVPSSYDWAAQGLVHTLDPPRPDADHVNLWGQLYTDQSRVRPPNSRVSVAGCELWVLPAGRAGWQLIQGGATVPIEGGAYSEDFTRSGASLSYRSEPNGGQSMVTTEGMNSHFWPSDALADVGSGSRAFVTACSARLVLADPAGPDDRTRSTYLLGVGADWRRADYACPVVGSTTVCTPVGLGRFVRVTNDWQRVVFSTMGEGDLASLPAPPAAAFANPDGSYGAGT